MLKKEYINNVCHIYFDTIRNIKKVGDLISILNNANKEKIKDVVLDFTNLRQQSYSPVHVSIAGIINYYSEKYNFNFQYKGHEELYIFHTKTRKPLTVMQNKKLFIENIYDKVIMFENSEDVAFISEQIINQLKYTISCEDGVLSGLSWCMNELMDNVFNHSDTSHGYIMAQIHKRKKKVSISIYDTGQGILNSIKKSGEYNPKNSLEAIELAIGKGVSGNRSVGQGNGMWGLKQIVENNQGYLSILCGNTKLDFDFEKGTKNTSTNIPYFGNLNLSTRIDFTLNFNKLINVSKALDNYQPYEPINRELEDMTTENGWIQFEVKEKATGGTGTRISGSRMRHYLLNLAKCSKDRILIDFNNVDMITSSFADEFIGKLVKEIGIIQFFERFKFINCNSDIMDLLQMAIITRQKEIH